MTNLHREQADHFVDHPVEARLLDLLAEVRELAVTWERMRTIARRVRNNDLLAEMLQVAVAVDDLKHALHREIKRLDRGGNVLDLEDARKARQSACACKVRQKTCTGRTE